MAVVDGCRGMGLPILESLRYCFLGGPDLEFDNPIFQNKNYNIWEIPFFMVVGVIGGLSGALFNHLNSKLAEFRKKSVRYCGYVANL